MSAISMGKNIKKKSDLKKNEDNASWKEFQELPISQLSYIIKRFLFSKDCLQDLPACDQ